MGVWQYPDGADVAIVRRIKGGANAYYLVFYDKDKENPLDLLNRAGKLYTNMEIIEDKFVLGTVVSENAPFIYLQEN